MGVFALALAALTFPAAFLSLPAPAAPLPLAASAALTAQAAGTTPHAPAPPALLLTGAHVLDPQGETWREGVAVLVIGERIEAIAPAEELPVPADALHLHLDGAYLLPGLIDLHTHLLLHPYDETPWNDQVLKESLELRTVRAVAAARATLEAGFTTIRDLGTEGAGYADVALRDAVASGLVPGPRIVAVTRALVASGAYGPAGFDPRWSVPKGAQVADGADGVRKAVREQIAAGADWIKVYADYRRRPQDESTPTFSLEELRAIVDEARSAGLPVVAHASTDEGIRRAVEAGVSTIEHGYEASRDVLALLRRRKVTLCPTLAASEAMARYGGWEPGMPEPARVTSSRRLFARALAAGVPLACGSDAGVFAHGGNAREIELMVAYGMSPAQALRAATSVAADVLGRGDDLGRIAPGALADLVAVGEDPLADPAHLRRPLLVLKGGRIALDRRRAAASAPYERELLGLCRRMLELYGSGEFDSVRALFADHAVVSLDLVASGQRSVVSIDAFLARARRQRGQVRSFDERPSGRPTVLVDHALATVWTPFELVVDGQASSGVDVFQLLRTDDGWRIVSLSFTNRPLSVTDRPR